MAASDGVMESVPTEFDYFDSKVIQAAIMNEYDRDFNPASIQPGAPIEILVRGASNLYLDLSNSLLQVDCKITGPDGADVAADANVGPANLTLHSLFSNIEMDLGKTRISDPNPLYPYRAFLETLLSYDKNVAETRLLTQNFIKDTTGHFDDFSRADGGTNVGFKKRALPFAASNTVTLFGRPHLDLFHQEKDIPSNVDVMLRLIPAPNPFVLKRPDANNAVNYRVKIQAVKLWVRTKELSPSLMLAHETMLQQQNMRLPYTKVCLKHVTLPTGITTVEVDNLYTGVLPDRLLVALLRDERMNGYYHMNPFSFGHFDLSNIFLTVNGECIPRRAYEPNFTSGAYIREYLAFLDGIGLDIGNKALDLTPAEWAASYPFFIFRLNPSGLPTLPKTGAIRLSIKFRQPTPNILNALCFAEFPTVLEIDRYRNVILA